MKPQNLNKILDELINLETDKTNYNLHEIPFQDWPDYEHLHLVLPENVNRNSVEDACLWLEEFYGFKEKGFSAYITSDHHDSESPWSPDSAAPSGFYFVMADTAEDDSLADEIYEGWEKADLAERPGYSKLDAQRKASQILLKEELQRSKTQP